MLLGRPIGWLVALPNPRTQIWIKLQKRGEVL